MSLTEAKVQEVAERAQGLSDLKKHPSWPVLRGIFDKRKKLFFERLAHQLMQGGITSTPIDQREIDYQRGFWAGAQWILNNPEMAERSLETALRKASQLKEQ